MAIDEPNAYSRNLFIVSMGFILYYYLDLEPLKSNHINLLMNPFLVHNLPLLQKLPWIALGWTWFSFFAHTFGNVKSSYLKYMNDAIEHLAGQDVFKDAIGRYLCNEKYGDQDIKNYLNQPDFKKIEIRGFGYLSINFLRLNFSSISCRILTEKTYSDRNIRNVTLAFNGFKRYYASIYLTYFLARPYLITFALPHLLTIWAIYCGIKEIHDHDVFLSIFIQFPI